MSGERRFTIPVELTEDQYRRLNFIADMSGQSLEGYLTNLSADEAAALSEQAGINTEVLDMADEERELLDQVNGHRIDQLIDAGKVLPVHRAQVLAFAASLERSAAPEFSAGEVQHVTAEWFWDFMDSRPPVVSFGATDMPPETPPAGLHRLKLPNGYQVDQDQSELYAVARQLERERLIPFADAVVAAREMMARLG